MKHGQAGHKVTLLQGGLEYFPALIRAVDESTQEIRFETYIFYFDVSGIAVAEALERAALRGLRVQVAVDGVGTDALTEEWATRFAKAGVQWLRFAPVGRFGWFMPGQWRRLHRKLCVIDGRVLFCGGINVLDDYVDPQYGALDLPRFDFAVRVEGPMVAQAHGAMQQFWQRQWVKSELLQGDLKIARRLLVRSLAPPSPTPVDALLPTPSAQGVMASLVLRDNLRNRKSIERSYRQAIAAARSEILIANAYFLPGARLRRALMHAARRGVRVRLFLQGRYEYFMQFHGARTVIAALLDAGVEIVEYQSGFLHAKVAVIDGHWATVGSSNLDPLSLLLAREANVVVDSPEFALQLRGCLEQTMAAHGVILDPQSTSQRLLRHRILDWIAYAAMRSLLWLNRSRY
jgi:cardiolipin synthase